MSRLPRTRTIFLLLLASTALLYALNFDLNDIWTENESFYADAVRRMVVGGDWLTIEYNGHDRFNKPPMTYWLMASSARLFGLSEFALRLPVVIMAFWTVLLTWSMARMLFGPVAALYAFAAQAIGIQFIAGKQYASPEIPLAFFFTLTLWCFLKGEKSGNGWYHTAAAVALGLTVLTKGYPYFIVIGAIVLLYLLLDSRFELQTALRRFRALRPVSGLLLAAGIGIGWIGWMAVQHGDAFLAVLGKETLERAFTRKGDLLGDLFFYPWVAAWGFFPYSPMLLFVPLLLLKQPRKFGPVALPFAWLVVMVLLFTAAKGKIPTYFIQAHPAMAMLVGWTMVHYEGRRDGIAWRSALAFPALAAAAIGVGLVVAFGLHPAWHLLPVAALAATALALSRPTDETGRILQHLSPMAATFSTLLLLSAAVMPRLEEWRRIDTIGSALKGQPALDLDLPLYVHGRTIHNLPFYAERDVLFRTDTNKIPWESRPLLVLEESARLPDSLRNAEIWNGPIYRWRSSESRLLIFIEGVIKAERGDRSAFTDHSLIYLP